MFARTLRLYRNAYSGLSPSTWLLAVVMFINRCGTMVLPFLTLYLTQHLNFTVAQAGIVMAIYGTGAFVGTFLGGRLTDRFGFYPVQLLSLAASGVFLLGLQFVTDFYAICLCSFLFTMLGDTFRPANSAAVAHYSQAVNRTRAFSVNRLAINLGWSVGGGLGGYLAGIDYSLLFWVDGLTCIAAAIVLRIFLPPPAADSVVKIPAVSETTVTPTVQASPYRDRPYLAFVTCVLLYATSFMLLFSLVPLYFKQELRLNETEIGLLMTMNGLLIVGVEMAMVYAIERRYAHRKVRIISVGVLLTGLSYAVFFAGTWPVIALFCMLLTTAGEMLSHPFFQAFAVERSTPQNRGQYLALHSMAFALAQVLSPALGSQVVALAGFPMLWMVATGLCLVSAAGFWRLSGRMTTVKTPAPEMA